jgi:hypothetical protein
LTILTSFRTLIALLVSATPPVTNSRCSSSSLDGIVGGGQQRRGHVQAERPGGLEINHELKFCRQLDRQIGRLGAFDNLVNVAGCMAELVWNAGCVADETAKFLEIR